VAAVSAAAVAVAAAAAAAVTLATPSHLFFRSFLSSRSPPHTHPPPTATSHSLVSFSSHFLSRLVFDYLPPLFAYFSPEFYRHRIMSISLLNKNTLFSLPKLL
jgi:hypothetical protein